MIVLDGYSVHASFASGGMATMHLAWSASGELVAVKRLHEHFRHEEAFVAMLLDEARLARSIVHPNVVQVLDVVNTPSELALVMEYVHGLSLSRLLRSGPCPPAVALAITLDVLAGLDAAHGAHGEDGRPLDIVHRDVSPHNVLIDPAGIAKLTDFGVAKAVGRLRSTSEGNIKGKLGYMSPEHAAGERVDARSDVYSAAIVLWELLSGAPLFDAPSEGALYGKVLRGVTGSIRAVVPDVLPSIDAALSRALARDPRRRFRSAGAFAEALAAGMPSADDAAVAAWAEERSRVEMVGREAMITAMRAPPPRRRWPMIAGGALGVGAIAIGFAATRPSPPPVFPDAPVVAVSAAPPVVETPSANRTPSLPAPSAAATPSAAPRKPGKRIESRCNPPYTIDGNGITHFKPECVK